MNSDLVSLLANVALTLSFIVGLVFGIAQVRAAAQDRRERLTLEALRNFQSREFAELMQYINEHDLPDRREQLSKLPVPEQVMFLQFAQEMEMLGMLVGERVIDIDLVEKTLGTFVTVAWAKYKPLVQNGRPNDPHLAEYFQWLAERLEETMRRAPRKPFYEVGWRC